jgi:hypothetical protein
MILRTPLNYTGVGVLIYRYPDADMTPLAFLSCYPIDAHVMGLSVSNRTEQISLHTVAVFRDHKIFPTRSD